MNESVKVVITVCNSFLKIRENMNGLRLIAQNWKYIMYLIYQIGVHIKF